MNRGKSISDVENLVVLVSDINDLRVQSVQEEQRFVNNAVPDRQREFAAGRTIARRAMTLLGISDTLIPMSPRKYPVWPESIVGSISHTQKTVGAAVALTKHYRAIGLDLEIANSARQDLIEVILTDSEQAKLPELTVEDAITLIFGCKEAIYKAVNPIFDEFLEFHDIEVDIREHEFAARGTRNLKANDLISAGCGFFDITNSMVKTLFVVE